jgi:DNA polymerase III delta subunit
MIYFIHGPDAFLVRDHISRLRTELDPEGTNLTRIDARSTPAKNIATMAGTPPFFGDGRVLIVDDLFAGKSRGKRAASGGDDTESSGSAPSSDALSVLTSLVAPNVLILAEPSLSSVPAAVKKLGLKMEVHAGIPPRGPDLLEFVSEQATAAGSSIDRRAATQLLDLLAPGSWRQAASNPRYDAPPDLDAIQQEVRKLAAYTAPDSIRDTHVREMTSAATADQLFPFLSALFGGDANQAVKLLDDSLRNSDDLFRIVAQVMQQAELAVPLEAAKGVPPERVGVDLGVTNPRRMIAIERSSRVQPVTPMHDAIIGADRAQKTGKLRTPEDLLFAVLAAAARQKQTRAR